MSMDAVNVASVIVAAIAALSAYASQRNASRASTINTQATSRVDMEKEAYERARQFDTDTIERQDKEIQELRQEIAVLKAAHRKELEEFREENRRLRLRVVRLERGITLEDLENIRERREDLPGYGNADEQPDR
jgi:TolA-binding protein